jgi:polar amino acid transport system substrate-binding protein
MVAVGCGSDDKKSDSNSGSGGKKASEFTTPPPLEQDGEFLFCTDVPYPPAEYLEGSKFVGYEIEIAEEVARRVGTTASFQKTGFDGIIAALQGKKCDGIISSMNVTEEREKQVAFVKYMVIGQSIMATPDLATDVKTLEDLAGKTVAVQVGTTLKDRIEEVNTDLEDAGKDSIEVKIFPDAGAAANALRANKVDAFFADSPVVADYIGKDPKSFAFAGEPVDPLPVGIALRLDDKELQEAVQKAVDDMYEDGAMMEILAKWKIKDFALDAADDKMAGDDKMAEGDDAADTTSTEETTTETTTAP